MNLRNDDSMPGTNLFIDYPNLNSLVASEVEGLTDDQLDWDSDDWEWSEWNIRKQLSHMAHAIYVHLVRRWGDVLFPNDEHGLEDVVGLSGLNDHLTLDPSKYWELPVLMDEFRKACEFMEIVLANRSVGFLRRHYLAYSFGVLGDHWTKIHPTGIYYEPGNPTVGAINIEATIRHLYFENITHLYNIQRLKRAQGLSAVVETPRIGYWTIEQWDTSEPG